MRVGVFGGSFDPFHLGHLAVAREARMALGLDRVLVLPTAVPPHKPGRQFAPPFARYAMVEVALLDEAELFVSPVELTPGVPAYAIETLERLSAEAPDDDHVLLIGADSLAAFDGWRRWEDLLARFELGVFTRPGYDWATIEESLAPPLRAAIAAARLSWIRSTRHPASASEIRRRFAAGEPIPRDWLDPRVLAFVEKYRLYR